MFSFFLSSSTRRSVHKRFGGNWWLESLNYGWKNADELCRSPGKLTLLVLTPCCIGTLFVVLTLCLSCWHSVCIDLRFFVTPFFDDLRFWMMAEKMQMNYADHLGNKLLVLTLCLLYWHSVCCIDTLFFVLTLCLYWLEILCDAFFDDLRFWMMAEKMQMTWKRGEVDDLRFWMLAEKTQMHNADHLRNKLGNTCKTHTSAQWASSSDAFFDDLKKADECWLEKCRWIMQITWAL